MAEMTLAPPLPILLLPEDLNLTPSILPLFPLHALGPQFLFALLLQQKRKKTSVWIHFKGVSQLLARFITAFI